MKRNFDILIVGGGIFGTSLFYNCTKMVTKNVALFEKNKFCNGATGRSGGLIKFLHSSNRLCELSARSFIELKRFAKETNNAFDFIKTGFITIEKGSHFSKANKRIQLLKNLGIKIEQYTIKEFKTKYKDFCFLQEDAMVFYEKQSGYASPYKTAHAYLSAGLQEGGLAFEDIQVLDILTRNGKVVGLNTSYGIFKAPCVVLATGAWSNEILKKLGLITPTFINKAIQVDFFQYPIGIRPLPSFIDKTIGVYGFDYGNKQCLLGTTTEWFPNHTLLSEKRSKLLIKSVCRQLPWLSSQHWMGGRVGVDAYTNNGEGIASFSKEISGLFLCSGWSGIGFKMAPACGKEAAKQILSEFF